MEINPVCLQVDQPFIFISFELHLVSIHTSPGQLQFTPTGNLGDRIGMYHRPPFSPPLSRGGELAPLNEHVSGSKEECCSILDTVEFLVTQSSAADTVGAVFAAIATKLARPMPISRFQVCHRRNSNAREHGGEVIERISKDS